jgi:predicted metal-dependent phosphoesterase TrpH
MKPATARPILPANGAIDLQMHTIWSDGTWMPTQLLEYLVHEQFSLAAITDHERTDTAAALQQLAQERAFHLVVAAEITATWNGEPTDVLCYGFEPGKTKLQELATDIMLRQEENTRHVCANLARMGIVLQQDESQALLAEPSSQQPHALVTLLQKHGYDTGKPSAADLVNNAGFSWATCDIGTAVEAAHDSGGVCLIAHPGRGEGYICYDAQLLDELRRAVPIDGLEVYYPAHTPEQVTMYREYAETHHLFMSSGSDSHGPDKKPIKYPAAWCRALLERLGFEIQ